MQRGFRAWIAGLLYVAAIATLAACSGEKGANQLLGVDRSGSSTDRSGVPGDPGESGATGPFNGAEGSPAIASSSRLEAALNPVIAVDASGKARSEDEAGTARDRLTAQVEIAKADFGRLRIDAADGFQDEVVRLVVTRGGAQVFARRLQFSENRAADITFELDVRGAGAPELQAGDVARVFVNGQLTLRGTFQP